MVISLDTVIVKQANLLFATLYIKLSFLKCCAHVNIYNFGLQSLD